jgi:hypothetical protein
MVRETKSVVRLSTVVIVMFATMMTLTPLVAESKDYLPLAVGNRWAYSYTITATTYPYTMRYPTLGSTSSTTGEAIIEIVSTKSVSGAQCYVLHYTIQGILSGTECYGWQDGQLYVYERTMENPYQNLELAPPQPMLADPINIGQKWTWTGTIYDKYYGSFSGTISTEVIRQETVQVPGGTFTAYLVNSHLDRPDVWGTQQRWYAQGIGLVREYVTIMAVDGSTFAASTQLENYHIANWADLNKPYLVGLLFLIILVSGAALYVREGKKRKSATVVQAPAVPQVSLNMPGETTKFCRYCGVRILRDSKFCEECGKGLV